MERIQALSFQPVADPRTARATGGSAPSSGVSEDFAEGTATVLPRLPPTRSLPFLAHYLAQEIIGEETAPTLWRARDTAYRSVASANTVTARLNLEA